MPYKKKTHEQCRALVCLICYSKVNNNGRSITGPLEQLVKQKVSGFQEYSTMSTTYPSKICSTCRWKLLKEKHITPLNIMKSCRQKGSEEECSCQICHIAKLNGHQYTEYMKQLRSVKSNKDLVKSNICPHCFHEIGIGKSHTCNKTEKLKNIEKHLTPAMKEKIAATVIKEKVHQNGKTADIKLNPTQGGVVLAGQGAGGGLNQPPYLYFAACCSRRTKTYIYNLQDISNHLAKSA